MKEAHIGGQAVLEGVMLRGKKNWVVAVRKPDQRITVAERKTLGLTERASFLKWYVFRGVVALVETLILGVRALGISAEEATEDDVKITPRDMTLSIILAIVFAVGLFIVIPVGLTRTVDNYVASVVVLNVIEGILRIAIFFGYILFVSRIKDISRVFEYHGAEHKVINAFEAKDELTTEACSKYSTQHVACGTSFMLLVMVVSILVFSLLGKPTILFRVFSRLLVIPFVAGISYEIIKVARKYRNFWLTKIVMAPGLWLQKLTTREPSSDQLEVALFSLTKLLDLEGIKKPETEAN